MALTLSVAESGTAADVSMWVCLPMWWSATRPRSLTSASVRPSGEKVISVSASFDGFAISLETVHDSC